MEIERNILQLATQNHQADAKQMAAISGAELRLQSLRVGLPINDQFHDGPLTREEDIYFMRTWRLRKNTEGTVIVNMHGGNGWEVPYDKESVTTYLAKHYLSMRKLEALHPEQNGYPDDAKLSANVASLYEAELRKSVVEVQILRRSGGDADDDMYIPVRLCSEAEEQALADNIDVIMQLYQKGDITRLAPRFM